MTIQVKHSTSVQGADDPSKSVNASEWNADHFISGAVSVGAFDTLSAAVSTVQANVSALSVSLSVLDARVSVNSVFMAGISGGAGELHPTSAEWVSHLADDSALSVQVSNLSVQQAALSAVVSSNATVVSVLSVAVSVVQANVSSLSVETSTIRANVSTISVEVSAVRANLSSLSVAVSVVQANVSSLSVSLSVVQAGLSNEISARALSVNNLSAIVSTNLAQVSTLSALHSTLSVQHSSLSAQVSTLSVQHSSLSALNSAMSAQLSTLSVQHSSLSALESALSVQVSALSAQMTSLMAIKAVLKSSQVVSVSTPANVSAMGFSVGAGNTYAFKYYVIYTSAAPASGLGLTVTFPGMTNFAATAEITSGVDGVAGIWSGSITTSGDRVQAISTQTSTEAFYATLYGACKVSTSGTLQLQAFPEVSGAANQIVVKEGTAGAIWRTG